VASARAEVSYLDTHVVAWLYAGVARKLSAAAKRTIARDELRVAPVVALELEYLFEIGRVRERAGPVIATLGERMGVAVCEHDAARVVARACDLAWTRDLFDRLIVAQAAVAGDRLLTADAAIHAHYAKARW
jgi:PIN domain nuclease of toxin-antitoxin system